MDRTTQNNPRKASLDALYSILEKGERPKAVLNNLPKFDGRDTALIMKLTYGVLRNLLNVDHVLNQFIKNPQKKLNPWIKNNLRLGIYQLLYTDRLPDRAVVHEAVNLAKIYGKPKMDGFVNAVLRNVIRNRRAIKRKPVKKHTPTEIATVTSHPVWLIKRWSEQYDLEEALAMATANNQIPGNCLRVNTLKTGRTRAGAFLKRHGISFRFAVYSPDGIEVLSPVAFERFSGELKSFFQPQDEASQLISYLVSPYPGERVLDACAAPGGKTTHMAQLMKDQGEIVALDYSRKRMKSLLSNVERLGVHIIKPVVDALENKPLLGKFDKILLDAPCTGTGVIRRNPDIKWKRQETDFVRFHEKQLRLLECAVDYLKPGGIIVYSVCSIDSMEGEEVIWDFLSGHKRFNIKTFPMAFEFVRNNFFKTFPHKHQMDGFFAARLEKIK